MDKGLLQKEADEWRLVVWVPQRSQAFKDASDAQVVMSLPVNEGKNGTKLITGFVGGVCVKVMLNLICSHVQVFKSLGPVRRPLDLSCLLILQPDPIEVQHQLVGLQQVVLGDVISQKSLED